MSDKKRIQMNVRLTEETITKLDEIVDYYQEHTKVGRVYKNDVLTDIIDEAYGVMVKQRERMNNNKY